MDSAGLAAKLAALATTLLTVSSTVHAQNFPDGLLGYSSAPGLSESCAEALNTTVANCPVYLAQMAVQQPRLEAALLQYVCTAGCKSSLQNVRGVIAAGCGSKTDVLQVNSVVYPATFVIDNLLYAYDMSCAKDKGSGQFCDQLYMDALANDTQLDSCSDCALAGVQRQLNSPFGYDAEFAQGFQSVTAKCGASGYGFTSPAPYAISTSTADPEPTTGPSCAAPYVVQQGDTCDSISTAKGVSFYSVVKAARTDTACSILNAGDSICLPQSCSVRRVEYDDTCQGIVDSISGLRASDLLIWNPDINPLCTNLEYFANKLICVSPPGRALADVTTITDGPVPTQPPPTPVPRPDNAKAESNTRCAGWYEIQKGDACQAISVKEGISLQDFLFLNPSIDTACSNLWLETSYCVRAVGDINTYTSYPFSTSPVYTLTSSAYDTTSVSTLAPVVAEATPVVELPLAPGSTGESDGCLEFASYRAVVPQMDQSLQTDAPTVNKSINSCEFALGAFGAEMSDILSWNPSLKSVSPCYLQKGYRYCAAHRNSTPTPLPTSTRNCLSIETAFPGTDSSCSCFTVIQGYAASYFGCQGLLDEQKITLKDLLALNSWIGGTDVSSCDKGLYSGLAADAERAVCVGTGGVPVPGGPTSSSSVVSSASATTSTSAGATPAAPTQTGIVAGCRKFYTAKSGDGCWSIANDNGVALDSFYQWNSAVGTDCANLWLGYAYCVQGPAPVPAPGPTQEGATSSCVRWHTVVSGDSCPAIQATYNIAQFSTLLGWNPSIGSNCENMWLGYSVCVMV